MRRMPKLFWVAQLIFKTPLNNKPKTLQQLAPSFTKKTMKISIKMGLGKENTTEQNTKSEQTTNKTYKPSVIGSLCKNPLYNAFIHWFRWHPHHPRRCGIDPLTPLAKGRPCGSSTRSPRMTTTTGQTNNKQHNQPHQQRQQPVTTIATTGHHHNRNDDDNDIQWHLGSGNVPNPGCKPPNPFRQSHRQGLVTFPAGRGSNTERKPTEMVIQTSHS